MAKNLILAQFLLLSFPNKKSFYTPMMKMLICFLLLSNPFHLLSQNPEGFDKMAKEMAGQKVPIITHVETQKLLSEKQNIVLLDTREWKEYQTSHLPGAIWIGYENIDWKKIEKLDKNTLIILYCSVGFRSGKIGEQLLKKKFKKVKNLYGGLFNWVNNDGKLIDNTGVGTKNVHGFDKSWSQWLNKDKCTVVL